MNRIPGIAGPEHRIDVDAGLRLFLGCDTLSPGNGGICRVARLMLRSLCDAGYNPEVAAFADRHCSQLGNGKAYAAGASKIRFLTRTWQAATRNSRHIYDSVNIARAHCPLPGMRRPYMTFLHGFEVWHGTTRPAWIASAHAADRLLVNSAYTKARADSSFGGFGRAQVCWLGTETDDPPASRPATSGPPTVLIVGRMDAAGYKGHQALLDAWPAVIGAVPDARLIIVGKGPGLPDLQHRAEGLRHVEFRGFVPDEKLDSLWSAATVFAMPSRGEGFGLVYIEAMRYAVPVIASIHDAAQEVNLHGETGYNVDLDTQDELVERLLQLLRNRDHAAELGRRGRQRWADHFGYSAFRNRFLEQVRDWTRN